MTRAIQQSVRFPVRPDVLYRLYTDSKQHAAATGGRAHVSARPGSGFTAFGGMLRGRMLAVVPGRMVVQTWRGSTWKKSDLDSVLVITFGPARGGGRVDLVHVNVPAKHHAGITRGWRTYYWKPWRAHLRARARQRPGR
ncbi:MAG TPA: SRPBCC domain-containing protein [Methylomirabilota bacterium]|nr:SRPBCC domain-containing protein [Methylomirabilota bacterium]